MRIWNGREIRPDRAIQKTPPNRPDHRRDAQDIYPVPLFSEDKIICKKWNPQDMIEMRMGNEEIFYFRLTFHVKNIGETSRIE